MFKKLFWAILSGLTVFAVAAAVFLALSIFAGPAAKPVLTGFSSVAREVESIDRKVYAGTVVREEYEYLCGDVHIVYLGRAPRELIGCDRAALERRYPAGDGWTIEAGQDALVLRKQFLEFCPEHKNYRHLGISEGYLAIFEGPLGNNQKLLRVEKKIPVARLSADYQIKLEQAMNFEQQLPGIQARLREELEFAGESALNAGLENLDEHVLHEHVKEKPERKSGLNFLFSNEIFSLPAEGGAGHPVEL
ncbi:MAG: BofC C-terminal domain-containing protein [Bacillota bacterium]